MPSSGVPALHVFESEELAEFVVLGVTAFFFQALSHTLWTDTLGIVLRPSTAFVTPLFRTISSLAGRHWDGAPEGSTVDGGHFCELPSLSILGIAPGVVLLHVEAYHSDDAVNSGLHAADGAAESC